MFVITVNPRFGEMDVLGHINNTALPAWFELARNPLFEIFAPEKSFTDGTFSLIMAHIDFDFIAEIHFGCPVEIRSFISRIGTKSFTVDHEAWQQGKLCCQGSAVVVYYDFNAKKTKPLPEDKKKLLAAHIRP